MLSRRDVELLRAEEQCWTEDGEQQWECQECGHLNEHGGRVCDGCEEETR